MKKHPLPQLWSFSPWSLNSPAQPASEWKLALASLSNVLFSTFNAVILLGKGGISFILPCFCSQRISSKPHKQNSSRDLQQLLLKINYLYQVWYGSRSWTAPCSCICFQNWLKTVNIWNQCAIKQQGLQEESGGQWQLPAEQWGGSAGCNYKYSKVATVKRDCIETEADFSYF